MTEIKITDFITALKHVVMFNSADDVCYRLNSLVIIDDTFNWDTDSIEARAEPEFYFSRDKERILYPALALSFSNDTLSNYRGDKYNDRCFPIALGVVDQYRSDCTDCSPCDKRSKQQIYFDTGDLLEKVLNLISNFQLFKTLKGATVKYAYSHQDIIDLLITQGIYDSATIEKSETSIMQNMWMNKNETLSLLDMPMSKQNTLAKYATINFCQFCNETEMNFTYKKYKGQECC